MRILLFGARGQIGRDISEQLSTDHHVTPTGLSYGVHVRDRDAVTDTIQRNEPDIVINCAAYHNVAECERDPENAFGVNATGVRYLAESCAAHGVKLIHISTDYVFGNAPGNKPFQDPINESMETNPVNVYGASKLAGENVIRASQCEHVIIRTAALYGHHPCKAKGGLNFVDTIHQRTLSKSRIRVVNDEFTTPTFTRDLAAQIRLILEDCMAGTIHATCNGECSWFDFATACLELAGVDAQVEPATVAEMSAPNSVRRPSYSVLDNARLKWACIDYMPHWRDSLARYMGK